MADHRPQEKTCSLTKTELDRRVKLDIPKTKKKERPHVLLLGVAQERDRIARRRCANIVDDGPRPIGAHRLCQGPRKTL